MIGPHESAPCLGLTAVSGVVRQNRISSRPGLHGPDFRKSAPGSKQIPTPHIDSLAAGGVRFTNAYASSSVCAPSRAGLMTGKNPVNFGFRDNLVPVQPGHDPTFVRAAAGAIHPSDRLTAVDLPPFLTGKSDRPPHASLMWNHTVGSAIRTGDWKLIRLPMLFHLSADPAERNDTALIQLDRARSRLEDLGRWEVNAPNPVFREPAGWRVRHLKFYDSDYQPNQPE